MSTEVKVCIQNQIEKRELRFQDLRNGDYAILQEDYKLGSIWTRGDLVTVCYCQVFNITKNHIAVCDKLTNNPVVRKVKKLTINIHSFQEDE